MLKNIAKNQQATHNQERYNKRRLKSRRFLKFGYIILILSILLWGWQILNNPETLPIESVQIKSTYNFINPEQIKKAISPYINAGFFNVSTKEIRTHLLAMPWIEEVSVNRIWPHTLIIQITEQQPIAQWGMGAIINDKGDLFHPDIKSFPEGLPILFGPASQENLVLNIYQQFTKMLVPAGLTINKLLMSDSGSIQLALTNGLNITLGSQDLQSRLQKFIDVYPKIFVGKTNLVQYIDMRYTNGMAVQWLQGNSVHA